jgi:hypothetical protein
MKIKTKKSSGLEYKKLDKETREKEDAQPEESFESLDRIESELERDGVSLFTNENVMEEYLTLPADLTDVNSSELGKYFNAFTQQKMWTRTLIGRLSTMVRESNRSLDNVRIDVYSNLPAKMSVKEKELKFQTDKKARRVLDNTFIYEEKLRMLGDYLESLIDGNTLISREITRRSGDWGDDKREESINKIRRKK